MEWKAHSQIQDRMKRSNANVIGRARRQITRKLKGSIGHRTVPRTGSRRRSPPSREAAPKSRPQTFAFCRATRRRARLQSAQDSGQGAARSAGVREQHARKQRAAGVCVPLIRLSPKNFSRSACSSFSKSANCFSMDEAIDEPPAAMVSCERDESLGQ